MSTITYNITISKVTSTPATLFLRQRDVWDEIYSQHFTQPPDIAAIVAVANSTITCVMEEEEEECK